ncbi:hypothetical protein U1Q18_039984 [Sarracenia purpurea var. burkii]
MCIRCEQISKLGHLSHLEVVELVGLASLKCIGSEFYGHSECILGSNSSSGVAGAQAEVFPALRKLTLLHMENLEEWRLMIIQALLRDAENRRIISEVMQEWLKRLELVASHTEDALDEIAYESVRRKPADQLATTIVEEPRQFKLTHPFTDDSKVEGRDGDVSVVIDMLFGSKTGDDLSVVAIAGVGKTTIFQLVYKDAEAYIPSRAGDCRVSTVGEFLQGEAALPYQPSEIGDSSSGHGYPSPPPPLETVLLRLSGVPNFARVGKSQLSARSTSTPHQLERVVNLLFPWVGRPARVAGQLFFSSVFEALELLQSDEFSLTGSNAMPHQLEHGCI